MVTRGRKSEKGSHSSSSWSRYAHRDRGRRIHGLRHAGLPHRGDRAGSARSLPNSRPRPTRAPAQRALQQVALDGRADAQHRSRSIRTTWVSSDGVDIRRRRAKATTRSSSSTPWTATCCNSRTRRCRIDGHGDLPVRDWVDDPAVAGTRDYRRVTVVVRYKAPSSNGVNQFVRASTFFTPGTVTIRGPANDDVNDYAVEHNDDSVLDDDDNSGRDRVTPPRRPVPSRSARGARPTPAIPPRRTSP